MGDAASLAELGSGECPKVQVQQMRRPGIRIKIQPDAGERSELGAFGTRMEADAKSATKLRWQSSRLSFCLAHSR